MIFFLFTVNGTWVFMAYLLHRTGVPPKAIAIVVAIGVLLGNVVIYASFRLAATLLNKRRS